jgi:hypothetical protein
VERNGTLRKDKEEEIFLLGQWMLVGVGPKTTARDDQVSSDGRASGGLARRSPGCTQAFSFTKFPCSIYGVYFNYVSDLLHNFV